MSSILSPINLFCFADIRFPWTMALMTWGWLKPLMTLGLMCQYRFTRLQFHDIGIVQLNCRRVLCYLLTICISSTYNIQTTEWPCRPPIVEVSIACIDCVTTNLQSTWVKLIIPPCRQSCQVSLEIMLKCKAASWILWCKKTGFSSFELPPYSSMLVHL